MVAQVVLAELASVVAQIQKELGQGRCAFAQPGRTSRQLRHGHACTQRCHAGKECVAARSAARLGIVICEGESFPADPVEVWCFTHHQAPVIVAGLHPANVIAHDEQDVWFLCILCLRGPDKATAGRNHHASQERGTRAKNLLTQPHDLSPCSLSDCKLIGIYRKSIRYHDVFV